MGLRRLGGGEEIRSVVWISCWVKCEKLPFVFTTQPKSTRGFIQILPQVLVRPIEDGTSSLNRKDPVFVHGGCHTTETFRQMYALYTVSYITEMYKICVRRLIIMILTHVTVL